MNFSTLLDVEEKTVNTHLIPPVIIIDDRREKTRNLPHKIRDKRMHLRAQLRTDNCISYCIVH